MRLFAIAAVFAIAGACSQSQSSSTISGRVVLDGLADSSGVIVIVAGRLQNEDSYVTGADGTYKFHISDSQDQRYTVSAFAPWSIQRVQNTYIDVKAGQSPTLDDFHFTPTGTFTGTVTLAGGAPNAGGALVVVEGTDAVAVSDATGAFTIHDVPVGTWTVQASKDGYVDATLAGQTAAYAKSVTLPLIPLNLR